MLNYKGILQLAVTAFVFLIMSASAFAQLPDPGMTIDPERTALLVTDPQNDFLSPDGVAWGVVGKNVEENNTIENIPRYNPLVFFLTEILSLDTS